MPSKKEMGAIAAGTAGVAGIGAVGYKRRKKGQATKSVMKGLRKHTDKAVRPQKLAALKGKRGLTKKAFDKIGYAFGAARKLKKLESPLSIDEYINLLSEEEQQEFIDELSENGVNINELSDEELTEFGETEIPLETLIEAYLSEDEQTALSELDDEDFDGLMELDETELNELSALSHEEMETHLAGDSAIEKLNNNNSFNIAAGAGGGYLAATHGKQVVGKVKGVAIAAIKKLASIKTKTLASEPENLEDNMDVTELSERLQTLEAENAFYRWQSKVAGLNLEGDPNERAATLVQLEATAGPQAATSLLSEWEVMSNTFADLGFFQTNLESSDPEVEEQNFMARVTELSEADTSITRADAIEKVLQERPAEYRNYVAGIQAGS